MLQLIILLNIYSGEEEEMRKLFLTTLSSLIFLCGCVTAQHQTESELDFIKTMSKLTSASRACGGEKLNLPNTEFNTEGRSKKAVLSYHRCLAKAVPSRALMIQVQASLWKDVFEKRKTSEQANQTWAELMEKTAQSTK